MLISLKDLSETDVFDFCIVGAGPAGITLALKLEKHNRKVLLLEGGGRDMSEESQAIYKGKVVGDHYHTLDRARLRLFGGSSWHWGGWCRQLDEVDFLEKSACKDAKWPISKCDLDPYLERASEILDIPKIPDDVVLDEETGIQKINFVFSPPVNFGIKYWDTIENSKHIFLSLKSNVTCINTNGLQTTDLDVEGFDGTKIKVKAKYFIIATGGIENSRLLLWSQHRSNGNLVSKEVPIGRYWMDHPTFTVGDAMMNAPVKVKTFYSLTRKKQEELNILNCGLRLRREENYKGAKEIIRDLACTVPLLGRWALRQLDENLVCGVRLRAAWEQEPRKENGITLSETGKDRFGVPTVEMHWRKSPKDYETVRKTAIQFGAYLIKSNQGRVRLHDWVLNSEDGPSDDELSGFHHMGGTRMASNSTEGVVDKDCKVFGQDNLYMIGSSVFPSGGHANPTLSIVQLSLRLGDHLAKKL